MNFWTFPSQSVSARHLSYMQFRPIAPEQISRSRLQTSADAPVFPASSCAGKLDHFIAFTCYGWSKPPDSGGILFLLETTIEVPYVAGQRQEALPVLLCALA